MPTKKVKQIKKLKRDANGKFATTAKPEVKVVVVDFRKEKAADKPMTDHACGAEAPVPCNVCVTTGYLPRVSDALYAQRDLQAEYKQFGYYAKNIVQLARCNAQNQAEYCFELTFAKL